MRSSDASASAAVLEFAQGDARPARAQMTASTAGEAGSREALARLEAAVAELKALRVRPLLNNAVAALQADDPKAGGEWAIKALEQDEKSGFGWYLLAIAREKVGDFASAIRAYESALALIPEHGAIANDLGRLAHRLGMKEAAEKLFRHFLAYQPENHEGANNLACALRDLGRYDEAIEVLRPVLTEKPELAMLWNTLGSIVADRGDPAGSLTFFEEAARIDPTFAKPRYNLGNARVPLGQLEEALAECEAAMTLKAPLDEQQMMALSRATTLIALGRLAEGWDAYEARLHPRFTDVTHFLVDHPRWEPESDLAGKTMLVVGEQGLGDEVLFANVLPDVIEALGPGGKLVLAVEHRLVSLFQRSFPMAEVHPHATYAVNGHCARAVPALQDDQARLDLWSPLASLLRRWRPAVEAFPDRPCFLSADPERAAHWKNELAALPPGRRVGVLWKSLKLDGARSRYFSPFNQWAPVLRAPGCVFVNLQYGETAAELDQAREMGVDIWTPPGIDLKNDLDDVAALCRALDLVLGPPNATTNIAAACGAPTWLISNPGAWPRLGTQRYPWYPQARVFVPGAYGEWDETMKAVAKALSEER